MRRRRRIGKARGRIQNERSALGAHLDERMDRLAEQRQLAIVELQ
jgi:hypothetical protein